MYENTKLDARVRQSIAWTYEAMLQLLKHTSYDKMTVSNVIAKAGISRATFYRHFKSKEDVIKMKTAMFFASFEKDVALFQRQTIADDEIFLINHFFTFVGEETALIDLIMRANLEGLMIEGIREIIYTQKEQFYQFVPADKASEEYTIDLVSLSAWGLIARWIKNGRKESPKALSKIYITSFKNIYLALFEGKDSMQGEQL